MKLEKRYKKVHPLDHDQYDSNILNDDNDKIDDGLDLDDDFFNEDLNFNNDHDSYSSSGIDNRNSDLLKELTNFEPFIKAMFQDWLGMRFNEETEKWEKDPDIAPLMNKKGAWWCVNFLRPYTRDNNIITNLTLEDYRDIMEDVIEDVIYNIGPKADDFEITDNGNIRKVCDQLIHSVQLILLGAEDGKYSDVITNTTRRSENTSYGREPRGPQNRHNGSMWKRIRDAITT